MQIAVTGSIATDHLMTFRGSFSDSLVVEQLDKISVSFLADTLEIRRGGIAGNICFGMAVLGARPILVGAAGEDFADYRSWLSRHGVITDHVHISESKHTARFVCTTDDTMAQIATFYAGAMSEARMIELGPIHQRWGLDLVLIGADDPEAMLRHTEECRTSGIRFVADPSQQLAFADGPFIRRLIDGADYLFTNEYESHLTQTKTGWTQDEIDERVTTRVITRGKDGADIRTRGEQPVHVPIAGDVERVDPTGVGDAFRAGFLVGLTGGLSHERCAQIGSVLAAHVLETVGTQEYVVTRTGFLHRVAAAYGDVERVDPTGVGDAFRAGFLVGLTGGLSHERCAQIGSVLAAHVLETVGTQEYVVTRTGFLDRVAAAYGDVAAEEIGPLVRSARD